MDIGPFRPWKGASSLASRYEQAASDVNQLCRNKSSHFLGNRTSLFLFYHQFLMPTHPIALLPLFTSFIYLFSLFIYLFIYLQDTFYNSDNGDLKKSSIMEQYTGKGVEVTVD